MLPKVDLSRNDTDLLDELRPVFGGLFRCKESKLRNQSHHRPALVRLRLSNLF